MDNISKITEELKMKNANFQKRRKESSDLEKKQGEEEEKSKLVAGNNEDLKPFNDQISTTSGVSSLIGSPKDQKNDKDSER